MQDDRKPCHGPAAYLVVCLVCGRDVVNDQTGKNDEMAIRKPVSGTTIYVCSRCERRANGGTDA